MANRRRNVANAKVECGKKKMLVGALLLVLGLVKYMGYDWDVVLMTAGALVFLKGLIIKFAK